MTSNTPLLDRIAARNGKTETVIPIGNRRPVWLRRMDSEGLPVQDRTFYILGAFVPPNDRGAA